MTAPAPEQPQDQTGHLTKVLAGILAQAGVAAERTPDGITIFGADLRVAVTAVWDNPDKPAPGQSRSFGVQIGLVSEKLFGGSACEYSYGSGPDDDQAAIAALERWAAFDLPVLIEASSGQVEKCLVMEIEPNQANGLLNGKWRIYAGPLNYFAGDRGAEPCCQICLLTMSLPYLLPHMKAPASFAIKLVAAKSGDGETSADCRRNGEDLPEAIGAIAEAASHWPTLPGVQLRRQYLYFKAPDAAVC